MKSFKQCSDNLDGKVVSCAADSTTNISGLTQESLENATTEGEVNNFLSTSSISATEINIRKNAGGRTKGSTVASREAKKKKREDIIAQCAIL
jgi:hypothetical protein